MPVSTNNQSTRLNLKTMYNVRDLGGYPTRNGKSTAFGRFLRADAPINLDNHDLLTLLDFPVQSVIDLRSPSEIRQTSDHRLKDQSSIAYANIPLLGQDMMQTIVGMNEKPNEQRFVQLHEIYINMLQHARHYIAEVFERLAESNQGAAFFHCTHGKDRTGLVAALLLLLADVDDVDIIANYQISATYLKPLFQSFISEIEPEALHFFETKPESMEQTLAFFHAEFNSAEDYLSLCGLSDQTIDLLKNRMVAS